MNAIQFFTSPQMEYLHEVINIASGNAARVMEQMLHHNVDKSICDVEVYPIDQVRRVIEAANDLKSCVRAQLTGDLTADVFFTLPMQQYRDVIQQLRGVTLTSSSDAISDTDIMTEFGNILFGAYTTALHDFCQLDISYTVPEFLMDMPMAFLDEAIARQAQDLACIVVIRTEFVIRQMGLHALVLLVPTLGSLDVLVASVDAARAEMTDDR